MAAMVIAVGTALLSPVPVGSAPRLPSVRLIGSGDEVTAVRYPGEPGVGLDLGTYLAAVGGPFEVRVRRNGGGYDAAQVVPRRDGSVREVRALPDTAIRQVSRGLRRFFTLILSRNGEIVASRQVPLCIGGYEPARIDDTGPQLPTYPSSCYASDLTRATVWGIDRGWAVRTPEYLYVRVPDGTYRAHLSINPRYVRLFDIPEAQSKTTLRVTVETMDDEYPCEPEPPGDPEEPLTDEPVVEPEQEPCYPAEEPAFRRQSLEERAAAAGVGRMPAVDPSASGLPDLVALPSRYIEVVSDERGRDVIVFGATVWNRGPGPLVVEGFRRRGEGVMDAYQYLYADGRQVAKLDAGTMEFDARDGHDHWHFTDFARYRLLDEDRTSVVRSRKEAFCLAPTDAIDLTLRNANWSPGSTGLHSACGGPGAIWIREILDVGWGDTYHQSVPGQSFEITDLPNGVYFVEVATNPKNNLRERTSANNVAHTRIRIGGTPGARTIRCGACIEFGYEYY